MAHSLPVEVGEVGCAHDRTDDRIVHGPGTGMHTGRPSTHSTFIYIWIGHYEAMQPHIVYSDHAIVGTDSITKPHYCKQNPNKSQLGYQ
jgi:hypothetical protein